jgi:DNA-binding beta-propeller fold protein YncE
MKRLVLATAFLSFGARAECRLFADMPGPEDIATDAAGNRAFITSQNRRDAKEAGGVFVYDLDDASPAPRRMQGEMPPGFHPLGLSFVRDGGRDYLFAANYPTPNTSRIERFEVRGEELVHLESLESPQLIRPNDLHAVGANEFYVTLDHGVRELWKVVLEEAVYLRRGAVLHYRDGKFTKAVAKLGLPNGLTLSPSGDRMYVGSSMNKRLEIYAREGDAWKIEKRLKLPGMVDNLSWDGEGRLYAAVHTNKLGYVGHFLSPKAPPSPSLILRVDLESGAYETVFADKGKNVAAASVGAPLGDRLLVGSVFGPAIADCPLKP